MDHWIATIIGRCRCLLEFIDASMAKIIHIYTIQTSIWRILGSFIHIHNIIIVARCQYSIGRCTIDIGLCHCLRISVAKENQRNIRCMHFGTSMSRRLYTSPSIKQFLCDCIQFYVWCAGRISFGLFGCDVWWTVGATGNRLFIQSHHRSMGIIKLS